MSVSKLKVALGVLLTVSALGVGVGVSHHVAPGGGHAGPWRAATPGAPEAGGRQLRRGDALAFGRYYAGGLQTVRGFAFRGTGPMGHGTLPAAGEFSVGGDFMFLNSLEYQVPIKADDHLYAVPFVDTGTVEEGVRITDYRVSAGAGLRVRVPTLGPVPVGLGFGFPIAKESEQTFSFWLGFFS
jgi:outer membrane protein assembly factor BamA